MGASTAYHLAKRGCTNVLVVESGEMFGLGSTGLNAGGIRYQFATAVNIELSKLSIAMMERFADEMDQPIGLRRCGYLFMLDDEADLAQFTRNVALQNAHGVPSRVVTRAEIAELAPEVELTGIIGGTWCPRDGLVDPNGLLQGYVSQARRLGATLVTNTAATSIEVSGGRVQRVVTNAGAIDTPAVVIAAGPWSATSARWQACRSPMQPIRRQIAVTAAIPSLRSRLSVCHRLLARAVLPPRGRRHSHRHVESRRAAGVDTQRRRRMAPASSRERDGASADARRRRDHGRVGRAVRGDAGRSADPRQAPAGRRIVRVRGLQRARIDARSGVRGCSWRRRSSTDARTRSTSIRSDGIGSRLGLGLASTTSSRTTEPRQFSVPLFQPSQLVRRVQHVPNLAR